MSMNFGETIKSIRLKRQETLHEFSMGTDVDMTLLSKFERNVRFPTDGQLKRISNYLSIPENELKPMVISSKIVKKYGINDTTYKAAQLVREQFTPYPDTQTKE
ncbi:MAG: helix-turn-helix domain-containing protein [Candidatus Anammoxibacter sp.]